MSENLKRLRLLHNISQKELADCIGTTKSNISKYECGRLFPTKDISIKLAHYFNLDSKYFYDDYFNFIDNFPKILCNLIEMNSDLRKNKLCNLLNISKGTLYRYLYKNEIPSRKIYELIKIKLGKFDTIPLK
ncbi:helix-turn-helix domain-containing protein [Clostridium butyricum]|uniref:helix-turn-helix domain-containing protein n=1 Tax=Clostridium butyricum TaxID=1492 RepID=UPI003D0BE1E6